MKPMGVAAWVVLAVAAAGGVAFGIWSGRSETPADGRAHGATEGRMAEAPAPAPVAETAGAAAAVPSPPALRLPDVHEIRAACPSLIGELTAQCESALERRFVGRWRQRPRALVSGVTYREIFALDGSTYAAVRAALARSECRVPPGRLRVDLGESCAADAMARLGLLHFACDRWAAQARDADERLRVETRFENERWEVEPDNAEWLDQEQYLAAREVKELNAYDRSWVYRKCRAMPVEALEWRGLRFDHIANGEYVQDGPPWHVVPHMTPSSAARWLSQFLWESAARLGSELAFDRLLVVKGQLLEEPMAALFAAVEARNPAFAQRKLSELVYDDTAMLAHALAAQMLARRQGLDVEWRAGWRGRGERMWYWTEDGEWADSVGRYIRLEAHERHEATVEAQRIVARIAAQEGWDPDGLDWSQVAAPDDRY